MNVPKIPNNSLTEEIKEILNWSKKFSNDYFFCFDPPISDDELDELEKSSGIVLPESYKDWLRFTGYSEICGSLAQFLDIRKILTNPRLIEGDDIVIIGSIIGDGEDICLSKNTGKLFSNNHGEIYEYDSFKEILKLIIQFLEERA